ncbi:chromo domain-containing protein, partial [Aeromonas veronii]|nr:chromo domain-containing protein [Aeromonas veronii]
GATRDEGQHGVDHRGVFPPPPPPPPPLRDAHGEIRWIVQRIVDHRKTIRGPDCFRIRWRGFPPQHDTWEPRNVLMEDVPDMVKEYETQHALPARR